MQLYKLLLATFIPSLVFYTSNGIAQTAPSFEGLGTFAGGASYGYSISSDGTVLVGSATDVIGWRQAFSWTQSGGIVGIGSLGGGITSEAKGVNSDGTVIVGNAISGAFVNEAFRWTSGTGMVGLGLLAGGANSYANAVSGDGTIVVGAADDISGLFQATRWTSAGGLVGLGFLSGGLISSSNAISTDGTVIVGVSDDLIASEAFRWTAVGGMVGLGTLGGYSTATGVNGDGSVIVGYSFNGTTDEAFRWTSATGLVGLGTLAGGTNSFASAINSDGSVIVGTSAVGPNQAFIWTAANGMESIADILTTAGVDITDWEFNSANGISADGKVIVGTGSYQGLNDQAFIFTMASGSPGVITPDELLISLLPTVSPSQQSYALMSDGVGQSLLVARNALSTYFPDLPLSSSPLSGSVIDTSIPQDITPAAGAEEEIFNPYGQKRMAFYTTGNLGIGQNNNSDNSSLNGSAGLLVELDSKTVIGAGLILGRNHEETHLDGESNVNATGLSMNGTYESLSGLRLYGTAAIALLDVKTQRNYMNASSVDTSSGNTNGIGYGMSLRAGYEINKRGDISIMPYTELQLSHSKLDAYTETGGAFPAQISKQTGTNFVSLLGTEISKQVTPDLTLRGRGAWGHRYTHDSQVTATAASLTQTITGDAGDKNWLELGMTMNYKINDKTTISADIQGRSSRTSDPMIKAGFGLVWNWN